MNGQPHMHTLDIKQREYGSIGVHYGDSRVVVKKHWWQKEVSIDRIRAAITEVIQQHDNGSKRAQQLKDLTVPINSLVKRDSYGRETGPQEWGEAIIVGRQEQRDGGTVLRPARFTDHAS